MPNHPPGSQVENHRLSLPSPWTVTARWPAMAACRRSPGLPAARVGQTPTRQRDEVCPENQTMEDIDPSVPRLNSASGLVVSQIRRDQDAQPHGGREPPATISHCRSPDRRIPPYLPRCRVSAPRPPSFRRGPRPPHVPTPDSKPAHDRRATARSADGRPSYIDGAPCRSRADARSSRSDRAREPAPRTAPRFTLHLA